MSDIVVLFFLRGGGRGHILTKNDQNKNLMYFREYALCNKGQQ